MAYTYTSYVESNVSNPLVWKAYDGELVFIKLIKPALDCLETISEWPHKESSSGANQYVEQPHTAWISDLDARVAKVFAVNSSLYRFLQKENSDLVQVLALADGILAVLEDMRANADCVFVDLFAVVVTLCSDIHVELVKPRLYRRQAYTECSLWYDRWYDIKICCTHMGNVTTESEAWVMGLTFKNGWNVF